MSLSTSIATLLEIAFWTTQPSLFFFCPSPPLPVTPLSTATPNQYRDYSVEVMNTANQKLCWLTNCQYFASSCNGFFASRTLSSRIGYP
uniref:Uncharacterized protein n=1 Tax=Anguilla anguilla TaxID=7936 RepID=A0A0E9WBS8_ANGAN